MKLLKGLAAQYAIKEAMQATVIKAALEGV